jgi:hypothetical protein
MILHTGKWAVKNRNFFRTVWPNGGGYGGRGGANRSDVLTSRVVQGYASNATVFIVC